MESLGKSWENTKSPMSFILLSTYKKHSIPIQGEISSLGKFCFLEAILSYAFQTKQYGQFWWHHPQTIGIWQNTLGLLQTVSNNNAIAVVRFNHNRLRLLFPIYVTLTFIYLLQTKT